MNTDGHGFFLGVGAAFFSDLRLRSAVLVSSSVFHRQSALPTGMRSMRHGGNEPLASIVKEMLCENLCDLRALRVSKNMAPQAPEIELRSQWSSKPISICVHPCNPCPISCDPRPKESR